MEKAKKQEREYDELISTLQADLAALEAENVQLRRHHPKKIDRPGVIVAPKRISHQGHHHHSHSGTHHEDAGAGQDVADPGLPRELMIQIESLKTALRFLRSENSSLRTRAALQDLGLSADISEMRGPLSRRSVGEDEDEEKEGSVATVESSRVESQKRSLSADSELKAVALETRRLMKDARVICASPKVVDLTRHSASGLAAALTEESTATTTPRRHWQTRQSKPEWQYHTQQAALNTIQQRSMELKERLAKVTRNSTPVQSAPQKLKKVTLVLFLREKIW